jgi:D-tyrosyl-tRNA(Tyr) deacylase
MRAIVQRVNSSSVSVCDKLVSQIGKGLMVLIGITRDDKKEDYEYISKKVLTTRFWDNEETGKPWSQNVQQSNYEILFVSQFTLCHKFKGTKLDFHNAMSTNDANNFFNEFVSHTQSKYEKDKIKIGAFGEYMDVKLSNDGPVTIIIDSRNR